MHPMKRGRQCAALSLSCHHRSGKINAVVSADDSPCEFLSLHMQVLSAGADGLVKLWSVRTSECLGTFDEHEAKVWALHVGGASDSLLVTGGADARVNMWRDCTAEDEASAAAERAEAVLRGQELANALQVSSLLSGTMYCKHFHCSALRCREREQGLVRFPGGLNGLP